MHIPWAYRHLANVNRCPERGTTTVYSSCAVARGGAPVLQHMFAAASLRYGKLHVLTDNHTSNHNCLRPVGTCLRCSQPHVFRDNPHVRRAKPPGAVAGAEGTAAEHHAALAARGAARGAVCVRGGGHHGEVLHRVWGLCHPRQLWCIRRRRCALLLLCPCKTTCGSIRFLLYRRTTLNGAVVPKERDPGTCPRSQRKE